MGVPERKPYPTDLNDDEWARVEPLLPPARHGGRPRTVPMREVVNALLYLERARCPWSLLPHDLPAKSTLHDYFRQWSADGTWARLLVAVRRKPRTSAAHSSSADG